MERCMEIISSERLVAGADAFGYPAVPYIMQPFGSFFEQCFQDSYRRAQVPALDGLV